MLKNIDTEPQFEMTFEINDKARGARKNLTLPSSTSLAELQDRVAQVFNVHTASLQLQYIFSNEKNNSLPFDLRSHEEYIDMRDKLQPFVVPKILANGKPSKTVRKLVTVQLFNRGMEGVSGEKGTKVSKLSVTSIAPGNLFIFYRYRNLPNHLRLVKTIIPQARKTSFTRRS
jgi:hypothetical protein